MQVLTPKQYQESILESVAAYFDACHETGDPDQAFYRTTKALWGEGSAYRPIAGFPADMPYFCLRVPTGGGKTRLAARAVELVNSKLLRTEHSVILWLVPSNAIREQTYKALRSREHPYHKDLRLAGPVTVIDLTEARALTRATLDTSTVVIVATVQAFRREDTEGLKVYESSGVLMHHFEGLDEAQRANLLKENGGERPAVTPYSLANVLRLRRPFVIVDEAHNSRTPLSFDTLARFRPSGILELTATPDTTTTPSNVLHSVSASELKAEHMIKLPIQLETVPDWQKCLASAIDRREQLHEAARQEHNSGAEYLRPLVLIQAQPRRKGVETLDVDAVKAELVSNHNIPEKEIVIATGEERGLDQVEKDYEGGIASPKCPVRFVITQQALAEGWDCPAAYILVSMAAVKSSTAVEQLLGRILRQPQAEKRATEALNRCYAYVVSDDFSSTANALRDRLVEGSGFEEREASSFVAAARTEQSKLDLGSGRIVFTPVDVVLTEKPELKSLPKDTKAKVSWDAKKGRLTISAPLSTQETEALQATVKGETSRGLISQAAEASRTQAVQVFQSPSERGLDFRVPQMCVMVHGELTLFDDPEVLEYPWDLPLGHAAPDEVAIRELDLASRVRDGGTIDVDEGKVKVRFMTELQKDLGLAYKPEHWTEAKLAAWICRNLPDPYTTHASKNAFVSAWLRNLLARDGFDLAKANRQKFLIRQLLEQQIKLMRKEAVRDAYQTALFGDEREERVKVDGSYNFEFHPDAYAPDRDYDGRFGEADFRHHYYPRIGDFDSKEEYLCACELEKWAARGSIKFWVRNLVRKPCCSFFLQTAESRFFPDFVCMLPDDTVLVVEYKGGDRYASAKPDRDIGELWAELSGGRCRFVMATDKKWAEIEARL
ncbi:MAG: DEAD/DEAH box helicase family protein [Akkermansiaceae bacterium]|nr:DEAD/DEAH box helicase family protein [Akkermansiaceae bacterium]MCP5547212.1 DEAD/DEAH box helicase family protein [Akkermansiaceae bacterium]